MGCNERNQSRKNDKFRTLHLNKLQTPETSQFILITEQKKHLQSPGFDHLGFLLESREDVDGLREKIGKWQEQDSRVEIKDYEDLVIQNVTTRAFYVKYLLPIWFDVQVIEYAEGTAPERAWHFQ